MTELGESRRKRLWEATLNEVQRTFWPLTRTVEVKTLSLVESVLPPVWDASLSQFSPRDFVEFP